MQKMLLEIPTRIEAERLYLRRYEAGDGPWYYAMSQKNRSHLTRYESDNVAMSIKSLEDAEVLVRQLDAEWIARRCFFMGAFDNKTDAFIAQIYVGPINWDLPEFGLGYFVDKEYEGRGFVTEAVKATLGFIFDHLNAHRVQIECDDTNDRSIRLAERCGFVKEGHLRENKRNMDGTVSGTQYFGLLKIEYEELDWIKYTS